MTKLQEKDTGLSEQDKRALLARVDADLNPIVELANEIGVEAIEAVLERLGGLKPHIPTEPSFWAKLAREARNAEIRQGFKGNNYAELAERFSGYLGVLGKLGERHVRDIVHTPQKTRKRLRDAGSPVKCRHSRYNQIAALARQSECSLTETFDALVEAALNTPEGQRMLHRLSSSDDKTAA